MFVRDCLFVDFTSIYYISRILETLILYIILNNKFSLVRTYVNFDWNACNKNENYILTRF